MADTIKNGSFDITSFKVGSDDCKIYLGETLLYPHSTPAPKDYFRFVARSSGTFTYFDNGANTGNTLSYSLDSGTTWSQLGNGVPSPSLSEGDVIMWKGSGHTIASNKGICTFSATTNFDVEGNIMSLHFGDDFEGEVSLAGKDRAFMNLFSGCTSVINASGMTLPATTLSTQCYCNMFNRAVNLATPPSVSAATALTTGCYQNMFYNSPSNTSFRVEESYFLPAQTLVSNCYAQMFYGCSKFDKVTCLATSGINKNNSTSSWLASTSSIGTFTRAAGVSWPSGSNGRKSWTLVDYSG